jgi:hypothetical protein
MSSVGGYPTSNYIDRLLKKYYIRGTMDIKKRTELIDRNLYRYLLSICGDSRFLLSEVFGRRRTKRIVAARTQCILFLKDLGWSYPEIGELMGRNHSTIMGYVKKKTHRSEDRRVISSSDLN